MIAKKIKILIKSDGSYLDTILPPITANEDGRTIVQVIAPFPITDIVSVNYSIRPIQATVKGSYLLPTGKFGKDVLDEDYTHFQTVADWNVFEIPINAVALEYISKYRAGLVLVSFAITQLQTPYFATNYLGLFSNTQPIPATSYNDGDYFIANEYNFTAHDITWAKGDYAYFYNGKWNKGKSVLKASTPSIELPVDPSLKDAPQLEYDEDVALLLANDLGLLTQRVSQSETDIESAENDINEIDGRVGVNETDIYNLESDVDDLETEIGNIKDGTTIVKKAEQDKLGNVINLTYETKADANLAKVRITLLENANMVKDVDYEPTNHVITFTFFDGTTQLLDLPLESTIVSASYDNITKDITFTLQNGSTLVVPLDDLVQGLASETWVTTYFIPKTEIVDNLTTNDATKVLSAKQGKALQDTKEALSNKATNFGTVNNTLYPSVKAVKDQLDLTAKLASSNVFTQPQQVPNATLPQHATNKLQVETMFEMFKRQLRGYNLGKPGLTDKTDLGGGVYLINNNHGITLTYNINDGIWTLNGTTSGIVTSATLFMSTTTDIGIVSATYIRVGGTNNSNDGTVHIRLTDLPIAVNIGLNQNNQVINGYQNNQSSSMYIRLVNGVTFDNLQFKLQIEKGSTATPYTVPGQIPAYKIVGEE